MIELDRHRGRGTTREGGLEGGGIRWTRVQLKRWFTSDLLAIVNEDTYGRELTFMIFYNNPSNKLLFCLVHGWNPRSFTCTMAGLDLEFNFNLCGCSWSIVVGGRSIKYDKCLILWPHWNILANDSDNNCVWELSGQWSLAMSLALRFQLIYMAPWISVFWSGDSVVKSVARWNSSRFS